MMESKIIAAYEKLSRRASLFNKYKKPARMVMPIFFVISFSLLFLIIYLRAIFEFPYWTGYWTGDMIIMISPVVLFLALSEFLSRKAKTYAIRYEEWLFLDVYAILIDINNYFKAGLEIDRKKAIKKVEGIVRTIEEKWGVGGLAIAETTIGTQIQALKQNLMTKLLPAMEKGDEINLKKAGKFLNTFAEYLLRTKPTVDDLDNLNQILSGITVVSSENERFSNQVKEIIKKHTLLKHALIIIGCGLAGYIAFCLGLYVLSITVEYAYTAGVALAGTLFVAYITYMKK